MALEPKMATPTNHEMNRNEALRKADVPHTDDGLSMKDRAVLDDVSKAILALASSCASLWIEQCIEGGHVPQFGGSDGEDNGDALTSGHGPHAPAISFNRGVTSGVFCDMLLKLPKGSMKDILLVGRSQFEDLFHDHAVGEGRRLWDEAVTSGRTFAGVDTTQESEACSEGIHDMLKAYGLKTYPVTVTAASTAKSRSGADASWLGQFSSEEGRVWSVPSVVPRWKSSSRRKAAHMTMLGIYSKLLCNVIHAARCFSPKEEGECTSRRWVDLISYYVSVCGELFECIHAAVSKANDALMVECKRAVTTAMECCGAIVDSHWYRHVNRSKSRGNGPQLLTACMNEGCDVAYHPAVATTLAIDAPGNATLPSVVAGTLVSLVVAAGLITGSCSWSPLVGFVTLPCVDDATGLHSGARFADAAAATSNSSASCVDLRVLVGREVVRLMCQAADRISDACKWTSNQYWSMFMPSFIVVIDQVRHVHVATRSLLARYLRTLCCAVHKTGVSGDVYSSAAGRAIVTEGIEWPLRFAGALRQSISSNEGLFALGRVVALIPPKKRKRNCDTLLDCILYLATKLHWFDAMLQDGA